MTTLTKSPNTKSVAPKTTPDMKAMCALMNQLEMLQAKNANLKQSSPTKFMSPSSHSKQNGGIKKRPKKKSSKTVASENKHIQKNTIKDWLDQNKISVPCDKDRNVKSPSKNTKGKDKVFGKHTLSASYLKYGVRLPTFEKILQEHEKTEKYKKCLENMELPSYIESYDYNSKFKVTDETSSPNRILDCKHLTLEETRAAVKRNIRYLRKIYSGQKHCERHNAFFKQHKPNFDKSDLRYNTSTITFTYEQNKEMVKMLEREFGDENVSYFFMVLLPELCLKIFMQEHDMRHAEATEYLEQRPAGRDSDSE